MAEGFESSSLPDSEHEASRSLKTSANFSHTLDGLDPEQTESVLQHTADGVVKSSP